MVSSKAATPEQYLAELPVERRELVARLRDLVNASLPGGYVERMNWGMISWEVPLELYVDMYHGRPLVYAALAGQKNYAALYLTCLSASADRTDRLKAAYAEAGKKLDIGKSCIRIRREADILEAALGRAVAGVPPAAFIEASRAASVRAV